jgi:hypothetical protein
MKNMLLLVIFGMLANLAFAEDKPSSSNPTGKKFINAKDLDKSKPPRGWPTNITAKVDLFGYSFAPEKSSLIISQSHPGALASIVLNRSDYRMPFGDMIPSWSGSTEIPLMNEYRVKIRAQYLRGKPAADFIRDENGLTIDVYYFHGQQLLDYESATVWDKAQKQEVEATLKDIPYCDLLTQSGFAIPSECSGYGDDGFRFWAAVRDGLNQRDGHYNFDSLSNFLKPLNRKGNLIISQIQVKCVVANPEAKSAKAKQSQSPTGLNEEVK